MRLKFMIAFIFMSLLFGNLCNAQIKEISIDIDTTHYNIDTSINKILISKKAFSIEIFRKKTTSENKNEKELALLIRNTSTAGIEYFKTFEENEYNVFNMYGRLYLELIYMNGGSGLNGSCYEITYQNKNIKLIPVYKLDELSLFYFNSKNEIIKLEGIWRSDENEAHFTEHRFTIMKYNYVNDKFIETKLGNTKFKYSGFDKNDSPKKILLKIKREEDELGKKLNLK